ncbi:unannotated protein [freshwater metagenome]|uniref:Unannotated protein n=1 Tax=freshwater metagenome TaxID=449393 RepID=A0A6J7G0M2_9ZZZZ|nr:hypothetical protein [Actinomycetota bacterium]
MKRNSVIRRCLAGVLVAGLGVASLTTSAAAAPTGKGQGAAVFVKKIDNARTLGRVGESVFNPPPIITIGPFSAGAFFVTFSSRVDTTNVTGDQVDIQCRIVADRGRVNLLQPKFRLARASYLPLTAFAAFTTSGAGPIAVKCSASDAGTPVVTQVVIDSMQLMVQRVSTVLAS